MNVLRYVVLCAFEIVAVVSIGLLAFYHKRKAFTLTGGLFIAGTVFIFVSALCVHLWLVLPYATFVRSFSFSNFVNEIHVFMNAVGFICLLGGGCSYLLRDDSKTSAPSREASFADRVKLTTLLFGGIGLVVGVYFQYLKSEGDAGAVVRTPVIRQSAGSRAFSVINFGRTAQTDVIVTFVVYEDESVTWTPRSLVEEVPLPPKTAFVSGERTITLKLRPLPGARLSPSSALTVSESTPMQGVVVINVAAPNNPSPSRLTRMESPREVIVQDHFGTVPENPSISVRTTFENGRLKYWVTKAL